MSTIHILTSSDDAVRNAFPMLPPHGISQKVSAVSTDVLTANFTAFLASLDSAFKRLPKTVGPYDIDEVELAVSVDANGKFSLVGEVSAGIHSSIKVKLKLPKNEKDR